MPVLFDKKLTFTYEEERDYRRADDDSFIISGFLQMYADGEEIFRGYDLLEEDIIKRLSEMALAILHGDYEYRIHFFDEDEGMVLGFIKAGRILQVSHGVLNHDAYYLYPEQLVTGIIDLLKHRKENGEPSGSLDEIEALRRSQKEFIIDNDSEFTLELQYVKDYYHKADRLKIKWGDSYYYTDTVFTNVIEKLLDAAMALLKNEPGLMRVEIADYNDDIPLTREEKDKFYRPFLIYMKPFKQNSEMLDMAIREDPWYEERLIVGVDEFISAVSTMTKGVLSRHSIEEFNALHGQFHKKSVFPSKKYANFLALLSAKTK